MKIVVIGCTHAGTAAITNAAKLYPDAEITVYERNDNISFLSCGIALYVEGVVKDVNGLFYSSPAELAQLGANTKMRHDVKEVDIKNKTLVVENMETGDSFSDSYDKLIVTTGSWPIIPNIPGADLEEVVLCKNYNHAQVIIEKTKTINSVVVVGGGYIGVELVEAFTAQGKKVTLIDMQDRVLSQYYDKDLTDLAENEMRKMGANLQLGEKVESFAKSGNGVTVNTDKGNYEADLVVQCIGFRPNTELFKNQLDMSANGAIRVNEYMRTSHHDVFAAGDSAVVHFNPTDSEGYVPLATNAVRQGTLAAYNLVKDQYKYLGTQSSSAIKVGEYNFASTGLNQAAAEKAGLEVETATVTSTNRPAFMPTYEDVTLRIIYKKHNKELVGAELCSKNQGAVELINTLSVCIQNKMTTPEVAFVDQFFQPNYDNPWGIINMAGLATL